MMAARSFPMARAIGGRVDELERVAKRIEREIGK